MAKLQDKFFNRVIEGKLELNAEDLQKLIEEVKAEHQFPTVYEVEDVSDLTSEFIENLRCGDVIISSGTDTLICAYKDNADCYLAMIVNTGIYLQCYDVEDDEWVYVDQLSFKFEDATKVVANPTLAGTESSLTGLQVGDTKYSVHAKPIYCHPITLLGQGGNKTKLTMLIFNNSATAFDRNTFKSYLAGLPTARFMTSGFYDDGVEVHVASYITAQSTTSISFLGYGITSGDINSINIASAIDNLLFYDGVNIIN